MTEFTVLGSSGDVVVDKAKLTAVLGGDVVPDGGTTHQVLAKASNADGDTVWEDPTAVAHGIPSGGTTSQALLKSSNTDYDAAWTSLTKSLVGLANVDNTSDANKPVSTAQAAADAAVLASANTYTDDETARAEAEEATLAAGITSNNSLITSVIFGAEPFSGPISVPGIVERTTISATAANGAMNFDVGLVGHSPQSDIWHTANATGNWTDDVRGDGTHTLNSLMAVGDTRVISRRVKQGVTPFRRTALTIDGVPPATQEFQGGAAPVSGTANGHDNWVDAILKTADATFAVQTTVTHFG